jgi:hypothetical protein
MSGCGLPLLPNTLDETILPYSALKYVLPFPLGLNLFIAVKLLLALTGAFALGRGLGSSRQGAILAAIIYGFTGFLALNINSVIGPVFLLPWCVFSMHRLALVPRPSSAALVALSFGLSLLGGNPQIPFEALVIGYGLYLVTLFTRRTPLGLGRYVLVPAAPVALAALLALPQLLPFIEYLARAFSHHIPRYGELHLDPRGLIGVLSPLWDPAIVNMNAAGAASLSELFARRFPPATWSDATIPIPFEYLGTAAMFFFIFCLVSLRRLKAEAAFFCVIMIVSVGFAFGIFPFSLLARVPPFTQVSNWRFTTFTAGLAASALAAMAFTLLPRPAFRDRLVASLFLLFIWSGALMALLASRAGLPLHSLFIAAPSLAMLAILVGLALALFTRRPWPLILVCALELLAYDRVSDRTLLPHHPFEALKRPEALESCVKPDPEFRFLGLGETLHPSLGIFLGRNDFRSYEMIFPDSLVRTIAAANGWDRTHTIVYYLTHYYFSLDAPALDSDFARQASVRSVAADDFLPGPAFGPEVFRSAEIIAPYPDYYRPARVEVNGATHTGWFQHAPSLLRFPGPAASSAPGRIAGYVAVSPNALAEPGDGVVIQLLGQDGGGPRLVYSRYLDPRQQESERKWIPMSLPAPLSRAEFSVLPGPKNDPRSDYALWGDFHDPGKRAEFEKKWELKAAGGTKCYKSKTALPRLRVAKSVETVPDFNSCLARLGMDISGADAETVIDDSGESWLSGKGRMERIQWSANRITAKADMESAGTLILADTWYPGWQARVDGKPEPIYRADCAFRAIRVPAGRHQVEFLFAPVSFRAGLWAGIISWMMLAAGALVRSLGSAESRRRFHRGRG